MQGPYTNFRLQCATLLFAAALLLLCGCNATQDDRPGTMVGDLEPRIPLPDFGPEPTDGEPRHPQLARVVIQRIDIPLDVSIDDAWAVIDQDAFPAMTRGAWQANGLRIGLLAEDKIEAYAGHMPDVLGITESQLYAGPHPIAIASSNRLASSTLVDIDLTLPPRPPQFESVRGGGDSRLQILARLEVDDGKTFVTLIPHYYKPEPLGLVPRDPLETELDGRVFEELAVRIELTQDRLVVVGLYWPWDLVDQPIEQDDRDQESNTNNAALSHASIGGSQGGTTSGVDHDPAAPPTHLRATIPDRPDIDDASDDKAVETGIDEELEPQPEVQTQPVRVATQLPFHFGRVLFTGSRARMPVQMILLISLPADLDEPPTVPDAPIPGAPDEPDPNDTGFAEVPTDSE